MKRLCLLITTFVLFSGFVHAQKVIQLPMPLPSGSIKWTAPEGEFSPFPNNPDKIVTNVSQPSITVYLPKPEIANGTAVVVCPGGAFHLLSMTNEGSDVAKWLNEKGVAAFVLKYRLVPSTPESLSQLFTLLRTDQNKVNEIIAPVMPLALSDGLTAIGYVREHAKEFGVDPKKIGIMGFSAGGRSQKPS
jgi:acetyl esterase/lipase